MSRLNTYIFLFIIFIIFLLPALYAADEQALSDANNLLQSGEYSKAISSFKMLLDRDAGLRLEAELGIAKADLETGHYEDVENRLLHLLKDHSDNTETLTITGLLYVKTGKYNSAQKKYEKALNLDPACLPARLHLARLQKEWGDNEAAQLNLQYFIRYYRNGDQFSGNDLSLVAQACVLMNRVRDANNLFSEATKKDPNLVTAYVHWGRLFLSKYNTEDARETFEDGLKVNPNDPAALLGLAQCLRQENFSAAMTAVAKAMSINENMVEGHNFMAELDIAVGSYESALEKLEKSLAINPNALDSIALRAICYYFLGQKKSYEDEIARISAVNPAYGDFYFQIAEAQSRRYLFSESVDSYRQALQLTPDHLQALAGLGTSLSRLGDETGAKDQLEKAFQLDPYNKHVGNLLTLFDEYPQYQTHEIGKLTIRIHERDNPVLSPYATELASRCWYDLKERYDFVDDTPVTLEIFPEHDDFAVRCFGLPGAQSFLGICFGNVVAMDSPRARQKGQFSWGETLWHELVHVSHLRLTKNRIPRWLAEGIAVYETTRANPDWQMHLDVPFIIAFQKDKLLPLKELDSGFNQPTNPGQVSLSYFQASKLVEFIVAEHGHNLLLATFPVFRAGKQTEEVIEQVFGIDVDAFDAAFRKYIEQSYRFADVDYTFDKEVLEAESAELEGILANNTNNPFLNFRYGVNLKNEGRLEEAIPYFTRAKQLFPNYVTGDNPYRALADIYLEREERERAVTELSALVHRNSKDLDVLKLLGQLCLELDDFECAADAFSRALYIDPFDKDLHPSLAKAYMADAQYDAAVSELHINLLTEPYDLAGANCDLAEALLKAGNKAEAKKAVLTALEIAPNYDRAQEILLSTLE